MRDPIVYTPSVKALGVFCCLIFLVLASKVTAECGYRPGLERVTIASAIDGDTLRTDEGKRLRLAGINAPELGRNNLPAEALGIAAKRELERFVGEQPLYWRPGPKLYDRYGRLLGDLYTIDGRSLSAHLLRLGLGFYVAVGESPAWANCLDAASLAASREGLGVWGHDDWRAQTVEKLPVDSRGFARVRGRIVSVSVSRKALWLEFAGPLVLRLNAPALPREVWSAWVGRELEVAGWLINRSGSKAHQQGYRPLMMAIGDVRALRFMSH